MAVAATLAEDGVAAFRNCRKWENQWARIAALQSLGKLVRADPAVA